MEGTNATEQNQVSRLISKLGKAHHRTFTPEQIETISDNIIEKIAKGEQLTKILDSDTIYPNATTFFKWCANNEQINKLYTHAREVRAHLLVDEILEIVKGDGDDSVVKVQRDRLRSDTAKWYAAKVIPKLYGDKVDITSNGQAINVISLGQGVEPPKQIDTQETTYIDVTDSDNG